MNEQYESLKKTEGNQIRETQKRLRFESQDEEVHGFSIKELASLDILQAALMDEMFFTLAGALEHGLLEWSAVSVAALTILLAFSHFAINKDVTTPIIGIALFCSGTMDAFHTLAAAPD